MTLFSLITATLITSIIIYLGIAYNKLRPLSSSKLILESNFSWSDFNKSNNGIVFIKTHKTSSSTLSRLIVRNFCEIKGRKCFLPDFKTPGKTWDLRKERDFKYATKNSPYEIWANHVSTPLLVRKLMVPDSFFISICRDPSLRFRSAWTWYKHEKQLGISLSQFIEVLNRSSVGSATRRYAFKYRTGLESVSEELIGLVKGTSFSLLLKSILTSEIYLLVCDRFDESLLILGQFLGLEVSDLIYKKQKVTPIDQLGILSEAQLEVLTRHQPKDSAIFKASNVMLDFYISRYRGGSVTFKKDLVVLRHNLIHMERICMGIKMKNISSASLLLHSSISNMDSNVSTSNHTSDLTAKLFCNSLERDNDEAVRYEWQRMMNTHRPDTSLLKKAIYF